MIQQGQKFEIISDATELSIDVIEKLSKEK